MKSRVHPIDRLVGQHVRMLRVSRGMSQTTLASKLGLTFQQLQKYEKGTNRISASKLYEIARALKVNVADLFEDAAAVYGSTAAADGHDTAKLPTRSDYQIASKLSQMPDGRMKRHVLQLISDLIKTGEGASGEAKPRTVGKAGR